MQQASKPEWVGVFLLGVVLFVLAVTLRASQPGLLPFPHFLWPVGALVLYALVALAVAGPTVRCLELILVAAALHTTYAFLMGCVFTVLEGAQADLSWRVLEEGLMLYPPAVLLQAAVVIPAMVTIVGPWLGAKAALDTPHLAALRSASTPQELVRALLNVEGERGPAAELALQVAARRGMEILREQTQPALSPPGTATAAPADSEEP